MKKSFSIKEVEQIKKSYEKLIQLDAEILALEKMGASLTEGDKMINLTLKVTDFLKKEENLPTSKGMFSLMSMMDFGIGGHHKEDNDVVYSSSEVKEEINDVFAIELVSFLLKIKNKIRDSIVANLAKQGVEI
jgi:hypothetical protein